MSMWSLIGWFFEDRLPLIHITALLRIAKESLHLSQPLVCSIIAFRLKIEGDGMCLVAAAA